MLLSRSCEVSPAGCTLYHFADGVSSITTLLMVRSSVLLASGMLYSPGPDSGDIYRASQCRPIHFRRESSHFCSTTRRRCSIATTWSHSALRRLCFSSFSWCIATALLPSVGASVPFLRHSRHLRYDELCHLCICCIKPSIRAFSLHPMTPSVLLLYDQLLFIRNISLRKVLCFVPLGTSHISKVLIFPWLIRDRCTLWFSIAVATFKSTYQDRTLIADKDKWQPTFAWMTRLKQ